MADNYDFGSALTAALRSAARIGDPSVGEAQDKQAAQQAALQERQTEQAGILADKRIALIQQQMNEGSITVEEGNAKIAAILGQPSPVSGPIAPTSTGLGIPSALSTPTSGTPVSGPIAPVTPTAPKDYSKYNAAAQHKFMQSDLEAAQAKKAAAQTAKEDKDASNQIELVKQSQAVQYDSTLNDAQKQKKTEDLIFQYGSPADQALIIKNRLGPTAEQLIQNKEREATLQATIAARDASREDRKAAHEQLMALKKQSTSGLDNMQQMVADHDIPMPTPYQLSKMGVNAADFMMGVKDKNSKYSAMDFPVVKSVETSFASGKDSAPMKSLQTSANHIEVIKDLSKSLENSDLQSWNKVKSWYKTQTGQEAPTDMQAGSQIVGTEIAKAIIGSGAGTGEERQKLADSLSTAKSPTQLKGVVNTYQRLIYGQQQTLYHKYKTGTKKPDNYSMDDFENQFEIGKYAHKGETPDASMAPSTPPAGLPPISGTGGWSAKIKQ